MILVFLASAAITRADSAQPTATPQPRTGWQLSADGMTMFIDQATSGPGTQPPEGPGFIAGNPLSPMTPYDTFSSAPTTPGVAGVGQLYLTETYTSRKLTAALTAGFGAVNGSTTNAAYWSESLLPLMNPHMHSQLLGYGVAFPTHAGQDDDAVFASSIPISVSLGANDGSWQAKGGYFDLTQSDHFVFVQPPLTNVVPAVGMQPAESLGNGQPTIEGWPTPAPGLPLDGVDVTAHRGSASAELSEGAMPALPGTSAHVTIGSFALDRGGGTRLSGELLHLVTAGTILTTTLFGTSPLTVPGPQGMLPTSTLGGQQQTIAGARAAFHLTRALDSLVEIGRAWYDTDRAFAPGTQRPGGYYHVEFSRSVGRLTATAAAYRFEPRYATAILPYGAPENVWSVAWSWPGVWLKSTYQVADNTIVGTNREGYRLKYALDNGPLEVHAAFAAFHQIEPASLDNAHQVGFVEGFFLPQQPGFATLGRQKQAALWAAWHPQFGDVTLDFVDDMMHRDFNPGQPQDAVSYEAPQVVLSYKRALNRSALLDAGIGRYAMRGDFAHGALTNVDFGQNVVFVGGQFAESHRAMILFHARRYSFTGSPSMPNGPPPNYSGSLLVIEQRFHI